MLPEILQIGQKTYFDPDKRHIAALLVKSVEMILDHRTTISVVIYEIYLPLSSMHIGRQAQDCGFAPRPSPVIELKYSL